MDNNASKNTNNNNTNKRENNSPLTNEAKNARLNLSPTRLMELMDKRFEKQYQLITTKIESSIQETENRILSQINEKINEIENKINIVENRLLNELDNRIVDIMSEIHTVRERVTELETGCTEIKLLKTEIKTLKSQIQRQENLAVSCDLRLNGIPFKSNENLHEVFDNICCALNISTPSYKSIFRLQNRNNKEQNSPDAVVLVKLLSPYDKNFILKSFALFRKNFQCQLCLHHIGFQSDNSSNRKVFINENLTSNNFKILQTAINLRKKHRLASAFTLRGLVYIKVAATDEPRHIDDINELNQFFPPPDDNVQSQNEMQYN